MGSRGAGQEVGGSGAARQGGVENHCRGATTQWDALAEEGPFGGNRR